jgi:FAD/FMN-containing dehydrogenase
MEVTALGEMCADIVGADRVITQGEALEAYSSDITENQPGHADVVVKPTTAEQVQALVRFAAAEGTPLTAAVARMNVGGLAIPERGGIVVDLSDMNRIIEFDREHGYLLIEPGVTFAQVKEFFDSEAPDFTISYPLSPPYTSVMANFLMDGLGNLSLRQGAAGEQIAGLEVVLPDGDMARIGSCAVSPFWFSRSPLPDLTGLFLNWQGSTGIVTKLSAQVWPAPPLTERLFVFVEDLAGAFELVRELCRPDLCRDLSGLSWPTAKMLYGVEKPLVNDPGEPEMFVGLDLGAYESDELRLKRRTVDRIIASHRKRGLGIAAVASISDLIEVTPSLARFAEFPMTLDFLLDRPGGGLTWVGTYGPTSAWEEGATRCADLMQERGVPPLLVTRPMKGGHYGVLRMITLFDKRDPAEIEVVKGLQADLLEICVDLGFVPYKMPAWAWRQIEDRVDPGFLRLMADVKCMLDPAGLMGAGRWAL